MKYLVYLFLIISNVEGLGQSNPLKPFRFGIVKPDTAIIHESLKNLTDSIEYSHEQQYYNSLKQMKQMLEFTDYPKDMKKNFEQTKKEYKIQLAYLIDHKEEILDFQYYELVSSYSTEVLNFYFNEYEPYSEIYEISYSEKMLAKQLSDSLNLDYILYFENLRTHDVGGKYVMKMSLSLFSTKEDKIILNRQIAAGSDSYGGMWTCLNELTCLLINSIRQSVELVVMEIRKRQLE
jgi:hypothetical protein